MCIHIHVGETLTDLKKEQGYTIFSSVEVNPKGPQSRGQENIPQEALSFLDVLEMEFPKM